MQTTFSQERLLTIFGLWAVLFIYAYFSSLRGITFIALMLSLFFVGRILLIILGLYKTPILNRFEKYGDEEDLFFPLPSFFLWLSILVFTGTAWFASLTNFWFPGEFFGAIFLIIGAILYRLRHYFYAHPREWCFYPHWLYELQERTSRLERRRLAYMWIRLPRRTRLMYNSSDRAFLQWADFVILSTLR